MKLRITTTPGDTHRRQGDIIKTGNIRLLESDDQNQNVETIGWYTTHTTNKTIPTKKIHLGTNLHLVTSNSHDVFRFINTRNQ